MSVTPFELLKYAATLAESSKQDELTKRNILSRVYYAAYHRACEFSPLIKTGISKNIGMHRSYIEQLLKNDRGTIERKIGEKLKSMYSRRISADYILTKNIGHDDVPVQLYSAKELFKLLENPAPPEKNAAVVMLQRK